MRKLVNMAKRKYPERECPVCSTRHSNRGQTCSKTCGIALRKQTASSRVIKCVLCGESFTTRDGSGKYCSNTHYKNCEVCGKEFPITKGKESKKNPTCGFSCGAVYSHRSESSKKLRRENSLKKWGVDYPLQSVEVKSKIVESKKISGKSGKFGSRESREAIKKLYGVDNVSKLDEVKKKKAETFKKNFLDNGIYPKYGPVSKINLQWKQDLEDATGLEWEVERFFDGVGRIDLVAENAGRIVAVEINPTATHNAYKNIVACLHNKCESFPCREHAIDNKYHFNKAKSMKELHNVSLMSIFDWMDRDKCISFIKSKLLLDSHKVYARKTKIVEISQRDANKFFNEFHMLGASRLQKHCFALVSDGEIVQVQSFAPLSKKNPMEFEARRMATRDDWFVVGGVSKLTKHFIESVEPESVVAFSDLNLSYPDYDVVFNDFERVSVNRPQKCWSKGSRMILDKSAARQSADRLLGIANDSKNSKYPEDWSNEDVFLAEGWLPVYDCGMVKDEWRAE